MRSVGNAARVQRERPRLHTFARAEVPAHIEKDFVRFGVVVRPRDTHRFGMMIEKTRRKGADNVSADLERLVDRRWQMYRSRKRLEIIRVESERIDESVPAHHIARIMRQHHARESRAV